VGSKTKPTAHKTHSQKLAQSSQSEGQRESLLLACTQIGSSMSLSCTGKSRANCIGGPRFKMRDTSASAFADSAAFGSGCGSEWEGIVALELVVVVVVGAARECGAFFASTGCGFSGATLEVDGTAVVCTDDAVPIITCAKPMEQCNTKTKHNQNEHAGKCFIYWDLSCVQR
jgi:hypothetical protein